MELNPFTNLTKSIEETQIVNNKSRIRHLSSIVQGVISGRSVLFSEIAHHIDHDIQESSKERRIQDFFQKSKFNYDQLCLFLLSFIPKEKLTLSIDRTEWDFGKTQINILSVFVQIGKMGIPLHFEMLDNNSGNSNYEDRIDLIDRIITLIGIDRIDVIVMDREFIGHKWLRWLKDKQIPFCVRVPKHHKLITSCGMKLTASELVKQKKNTYLEDTIVDTVSVNASISKDKKGELLYLVGTVSAKELTKIYKKRWSIEVFFQATKSRGFNMEKSCLRCLEKYKKLFAIISIAYTICWTVGIEIAKKNPSKQKKHGYPQNSVLRRGLNHIRKLLKNKILQTLDYTIEAVMKSILLKYRRMPKIVG